MFLSKHNKERTSSTFFSVVLLYMLILLYCIVSIIFVNYRTKILTYISIFTVVNLIIIFVASRKVKYEVYKHILTICLGLEFPAIVFGSHASFMPMVAFPIAVIIVMLDDYRLAVRSVVYAVSINLIFTYIKMDSEHQFQLYVQFAFILMYSIMLVMYSKMIRTQSKEKVKQIEQDSEKVKDVNSKVFELSVKLAESYKHANEQMSKLQEYSYASNKAVTEIMSATRSTAEMTERQTIDMKDIHNNINKIKYNTESVLSLSDNTKESIKTGVDSIMEVENKGQEIMRISQQTKDSNAKLNNGVEDVKNIMSTILGIAGQTNLLALNASIEAARAGEHGKGFAVVAEEIRQLSDGTKEAVEQITSIIHNLVANAEQSSEDINRSLENTMIQNKLVIDTKDQLQTISNNMDNLGHNISDMAVMINSIVQLSTGISDSVENLSAVSEEIAATSEDTCSVSERSFDSVNKVNDELIMINSIALEIQNTVQA